MRPESCLSCLCLGTMSSLDISSYSSVLLGSSAGQHVCLAAAVVQHDPLTCLPVVTAPPGWAGSVCACWGTCEPLCRISSHLPLPGSAAKTCACRVLSSWKMGLRIRKPSYIPFSKIYEQALFLPSVFCKNCQPSLLLHANIAWGLGGSPVAPLWCNNPDRGGTGSC